ncbi:MAG TPA: hypothetical protein VFR86_09000 [Burkholderiaceae bacterium]|nr:hypothetical protein [Burkholderiaceae bacterium]
MPFAPRGATRASPGVATVGLTVVLAACAAVGPEYRRPTVADGGIYTSGTPVTQTR